MRSIRYFIVVYCFVTTPHIEALGGYALANVPYFPNNFWGSADYLYWSLKAMPEPVPLVVEGADTVLGGNDITPSWRSGGRFSLGCWFDEGLPIKVCRGFGLDFQYLFLPRATKYREVVSSGQPGSPNYNIPYFNVNTGQEETKHLSLEGVFAGRGRERMHNAMQGAEGNCTLIFDGACGLKYAALCGFRYLQFYEAMTFYVNSPYIADPDVWRTVDKFQTQNNFYGGQFGVGMEYSYCNFFADATFKLALGATCKKARVSGHLQTNDFTNRASVEEYPGGYFTMPTNIGDRHQTTFAVVPEIDINLSYEIIEFLRIKVGYSFIYISQVLRAGKLIDRNINPTQSVTIEDTTSVELVGEPAPKILTQSEGLWMQGVNVGLEFYF